MIAGPKLRRAATIALVLGAAASWALACGGPQKVVEPVPLASLEAHARAPLDTTPKQDVRMMPPEAYVRSYLALFGGLAPLAVQQAARGRDGALLFDTWDDYLSALGFPDYKLDLPRAGQTNAIMVATFERLGVALCDRALEHDWKAKPRPAVDQRVVFAFDPPAEVPGGPKPDPSFADGFDVLHRTFLGYPAELAPAERTENFYELFKEVRTRRAAALQKSRFTPEEGAWASVCYGLVRHPEFHFY